MNDNKASILLAIKLVAVRAAKLADDLEHNRLWEEELGRGIGKWYL